MKIDISSKRHPNMWLEIDDEDYHLLEGLKIHPVLCGKKPTCYAKTYIDGKQTYIHRLVMGYPDGLVVDHVDHNGLNCKKENLRICSNRENSFNVLSHKDSLHSKYKGVTRDVCKHGPKCYKAQIKLEGKTKNLGLFYSQEDAAIAYNNAAMFHFGEFAVLNEI